MEYEDALAQLDKNVGCAPTGTLWRHLKSGKVVEVIGHGLREEDLLPAVAYLEQGPCKSVYWFRRADEFFDGRFAIVALTASS